MTPPIIYNPKFETLPRDELEQLQIERLQSTLNRAYRNVAFYRAAFDAHGVNLEKLKDVRAIRELPFTTRQDLQNSYPYDMFAVPLKDIVRIHSMSGTAGRQVVVGYTRNDLWNWTECTARVLAAAGVTEHDVVQIALDYCIPAGVAGFQQGAEQVGASVIPAVMSAGIDRQIAVMRDFKTTALVCTPSFALRIAAALEAMQIHPERLNLRLALLGGERWGQSLRDQIERRLHVASVDTYGMIEITGPGFAGECHVRDGLHVNEDHFIAEVIDPETLQPVGTGREGELVITTIAREGFPLVRYRTGDVTSLNDAPCPCGRTFLRMARVTRRTDDMILFHGMGFFPAQVERVLAEVEGTSPHYQIILDRDAGADSLEIRVEVLADIPGLDEVKTLESLRDRLAQAIRTALDVDAKVTLVEPKSLRLAEGGKGRIIDMRPV